MTYQFPERAIREVVAAIRDIDERADSTSWRWADMPHERKIIVCEVLYDNLGDTECCDIINDAAITRGREILKNRHFLEYRAILALNGWFETVIEPRVNRRLAAA